MQIYLLMMKMLQILIELLLMQFGADAVVMGATLQCVLVGVENAASPSGGCHCSRQ